MTTYESELKTITASESTVFPKLSDLNSLALIKENTTFDGKIKELQYDTDSCSFLVDGFGKIGFKIVERIPSKTIILNSVGSPFSAEIKIQLNQIGENNTEMRLFLTADIPMMIKMMVDKKMQEGINATADLIAKTLSENV